ncbi:MAG: YraN family protein [bacterium]
MPKVFTSKSQRTGEFGEQIAVRYLQRKGFVVIERNYTRPCGEIDIIAQFGGIRHFVEVKAMTGALSSVQSREGIYRPEDGMHFEKVRRLRRTVASYLSEGHWKGEWQFDLVTIWLNPTTRQAQVKHLDNIIL